MSVTCGSNAPKEQEQKNGLHHNNNQEETIEHQNNGTKIEQQIFLNRQKTEPSGRIKADITQESPRLLPVPITDDLSTNNDHQRPINANNNQPIITIDKTQNNKPPCTLITFKGPNENNTHNHNKKTFKPSDGDADNRDKPLIDCNSLESIHSKFSTSSANDATNTTLTNSPVDDDDDDANPDDHDNNNSNNPVPKHHCCAPLAATVRPELAIVATRYVSPPKIDDNWLSSSSSSRPLVDGPKTVAESSGVQMDELDASKRSVAKPDGKVSEAAAAATTLDTKVREIQSKARATNQEKASGGFDCNYESKNKSPSERSSVSTIGTGSQQPFKPIKKKGPFPFSGIVASIAGSFFFSTSILLAKLYPDDTTALAEKNKLLFFRGLVITVLCALTILVQKSKFSIPRDEILVNFLRAFFGFFGVLGAYVSLKYISMGDSTALVFSSPVWTSLLSHFILSEPLHWIIVLGLPVSLLGIVLIAHPSLIVNIEHTAGDAERQPMVPVNYSHQHHLSSSSLAGEESTGLWNVSSLATIDLANPINTTLSNLTQAHQPVNFDIDASTMASEPYDLEHRWPGIVIALCTSLMVSCVYITLKFRKTTPIQTTTFWLGIWTMLASGFIMLFTGFGKVPDSLYEWFLVVGVGACSWMGQGLIQWALMHEDASILSVVRTMDVAITFVLSALFLAEEILWTSIVGATIISLVVVSIVLNNWLVGLFKSRANILEATADDHLESGKGRTSSASQHDAFEDVDFNEDTRSAKRGRPAATESHPKGAGKSIASRHDQLSAAA